MGSLASANSFPEGVWQPAAETSLNRTDLTSNVDPRSFAGFVLDAELLREHLRRAPMEFTDQHRTSPLLFSIPRPDGTMETFEVAESPVMAPELQAKYPEMRTFIGQSIDNPVNSARFGYTPLGFHAQVRAEEGMWSVDTLFEGENTTHASFYFRDLKVAPDFLCQFDDLMKDEGLEIPTLRSLPEARVGEVLRTYRAAIACTPSYTSRFGGASGALASIVGHVNRVNEVFQVDFSARLELVANNNLIVYSGSSPFSSDSMSGTLLNQSQSTIDSVIGSGNYDVGHVITNGGGGLAQLGVVCSGSKARGGSGFSGESTTTFPIRLLAHELGHQFSALHSFNSNISPCVDNRSGSAAYERGAGTTIMAYSGLCGADNIQSGTDPMYNAGALSSILPFTTNGTGSFCGTTVNTGNTPPVPNAGPSYNIPSRTPFTLTGSATDAQGDALTYSWEEFDLGPAQTASPAVDNGSSPLFRVRPPVTTPSRTFPRIQDIISNTQTINEVLPTTSRTMNFRFVVRDNRAGGGGIALASTQVTSVGTAGPFQVTAPNSNVLWSGIREVTWSVANTNIGPINCTAVDILLSTDGGLTYPTVLLSNTPNTGAAFVPLPNINSSSARIMVRGRNNIFFDISNANFSIEPGGSVTLLAGGGVAVDDTIGNGNSNGIADPGEIGIGVTVPVLNTGPEGATNVSATLVSLTNGVDIKAATRDYGSIAVSATESSSEPFLISVSNEHPCGAPLNFRLDVTSDDGDGTFTFQVSTGRTVTGVPVTTIVTPNLPFGGDGSQPSDFNYPISMTGTFTAEKYTLEVNATHARVSDVTYRLFSPGGQIMTLFDRHGGNGQDFTGTVFDDDAAQSITEGAAPYSGTYRPVQPLSVVSGEVAGGVWYLGVVDADPNAFGGVLQSIKITAVTSTTVCDAPVFVDSRQYWSIY